MTTNSNLLNATEVGEALGITARQVRSLARRRAIPSIRLGHRTVRFELDRVRQAVGRLEIREIASVRGKSSGGSV